MRIPVCVNADVLSSDLRVLCFSEVSLASYAHEQWATVQHLKGKMLEVKSF